MVAAAAVDKVESPEVGVVCAVGSYHNGRCLNVTGAALAAMRNLFNETILKPRIL